MSRTTTGVWLPLRPELRGREPYGAPQVDAPVRLNTNENCYPPPAAVIDAVVSAAGAEAARLNRYPDREATGLRTDLAGYLTEATGEPIAPEQVWAANGSNEVLQQLLQVFGGPGRDAFAFVPCWAMYELLATATGTKWLAGMLNSDFSLSPADAIPQVEEYCPSVVFLCSPNNPIGTSLDLDVIRGVYDVTAGMVIVDEAYAEFARPGTPSAVTLLPGRPRLVVTRTLSKAFALAGVRLGYLAADPAVVDALRLVRLPYHLSALTQATGRAALQHTGSLLASVEAIKEQRDRIVADLTGMGLTVAPSDANFVLFGGLADSAATWQALLERGVLVRDVGIPGWLRVSAGTPDDTDTFLAAMRDVLRKERTR